MDGMTVMAEPYPLKAQMEQMNSLLQKAASRFQNGEDAEGIEHFLTALAELGSFVEKDQNSQRPKIDLSLLLPVVRQLYFYIQNQDIVGVTDLLQDELCPMTENWAKGCDGA